jgi:hypothetical protein
MTKYIQYKLSSLHGSIKHYFHFFYGVFVPIILEYIELSKKYQDLTFIIDDDVGPMLRILLELPIDIKLKYYLGDNIKNLQIEHRYLEALDKNIHIKKKYDKFINYKMYIDVNNFMNKCLYSYDLILNKHETWDVVLIERKTNKAIKTELFGNNKYTDIMKTSGKERRSIINHDELYNHIKKMYPRKKVANVSLEFMSIFEQYHLFNNTTLLIAQHGASLANIFFMKEKSYVIEIVSKIKHQESWFVPISKICNINHYEYITEQDHVTIDLDDFEKFVSGLKKIIE